MPASYVLPIFHAETDEGRPLIGGQLFTYLSGTTTPAVTYANGEGATNTNPVLLNARGEARVFLDDTVSYTFVLKTAAGVTVWNQDGVKSADAESTALKAQLTASDGLGLIGSFQSYDALRAYQGSSKRVDVTGVLGTSQPDGIAGEFFLDASDSTSPDNGGTVIIDALGRRWKRSLVGCAILSSWFGVKADGITDETTPFWAAHRAANGVEVVHPVGIIRITSPKPADIKPIRLSGRGGDAYVTHQIINQPQLNNDPLYRVTGSGTPGNSVAVSAAAENAYMLGVCPGLTIIKCDGCDLIGAPDVDSTMNGAPDPLRCVQNVVIWCVNGAKHGIYSDTPIDGVIRNSTIVLAEHFGYLQRAGITTRLDRVAFVDCGWNMAASGTPGYPNAYSSGCAAKFVSNRIGNDYTTIDPAGRLTTAEVGETFVWCRGNTVFNKSGFRGFQGSGALALSFDKYWGYTGCFFDVCNVSFGDGCYFENYSKHGFIAGDNDPAHIAFLNCINSVGGGGAFTYNAAPDGAGRPLFKYIETGNTGLPTYRGTSQAEGRLKSIGPSESQWPSLQISVSTPGGTDIYTLNNVAPIGQGAAAHGFAGIIILSLISESNYSNYTRTFFAAAVHMSGATKKAMPSTVIANDSSVSGTFQAVMSIDWTSSGQLQVAFTWGSGWSVGDKWRLEIGAFSLPTVSN